MFNKLKKLLAYLLPRTCILCKHASDRAQDLCSQCLTSLPILAPGCVYCATPLSVEGEAICGTCLQQPPPYERLFALFAYQAPITQWIMELKFHERLIHAQILGELMATALQTWYLDKPLPECIIPIPLHNKRLHERGFNQALELARPIAKTLGLALNFTSCQRVKSTQAQARLIRKQRTQNMKNAFKIQGLEKIRSVAVVDDVTTTGQTLQAFCQALKQAGVAQIDVWCCAKTLIKEHEASKGVKS